MAADPLAKTIRTWDTDDWLHSSLYEALADRIRKHFIVIDRKELPEAVVEDGYVYVNGEREAPADGRVSANTVRNRATALLAAAEHLVERDAAIDQLTDRMLIADAAAHNKPALFREQAEVIARGVIQAGWAKS